MSSGPQILLVDDEANVRRMLGALLQTEGFAVAEVPNGNSALLMLQEVDPDVVLLDLMMPPGPDGLETLTRMRDRGTGAPVIMMSGKAQLTDAVRAVKLGAFQFLEKPLSPGLKIGRCRPNWRGGHRSLARGPRCSMSASSLPGWHRPRQGS